MGLYAFKRCSYRLNFLDERSPRIDPNESCAEGVFVVAHEMC
jgi:hypothetical protein